ncbi:MAG: hypothetical protein CVU55_11430 [Deltaproteobacteria bacterium HGW-Deltaproteobacteria-13]|jgi:hypothetical protein|nr:MAG: hypothetical protein CVU55_11430 [Deltaproteobacteria bacterium HGW-Deltaproteobacteria-13]
MNKKVGILTFIWSMNYGAKLQALALQSVISSLGFDCELISYKRKEDCRISESLRHLQNGQLKRAARGLMLETFNWQRNLRFNNFTSQNIKMSPKICFDLNDLAALSDRYDAIICGSDQVWNPELTRESQLSYLLDFPNKRDLRRIAYAPSLGNDTLDEKWHDTFKRCLRKFDSISVREKSSRGFISSLADKEIASVLDPTLLLSKEQWVEYSKDIEIKEPYLLVYSFGISPGLRKLTEQIAKNKGLKIVTFHKQRHYKNELKRFPNAGPSEFLGLFEKADFVITNSFHGTAFSIILQKPFYSVINIRGARLKDLLKELGLEDRLIINDETKQVKHDEMINYVRVEEKLSVLRNKSIKYLITALK